MPPEVRDVENALSGGREVHTDADVRSESEEILPAAAEGTYLVMVRLHARGKESNAPTEAEGANLVAIRDGKITRFEMFWDRDAALQAAGLASRS